MTKERDDSDQIRKDEIFVLSEIYPNTKKEKNDVLTFEISEPEFDKKKIIFQVRFIESYPKISKPDYIITADWLPNDVTKRIKFRLNDIWTKNLNQPVVYLWIEAIKECVLKWLEEYTDEKTNHSQSSTQEQFDFKHGEPLVIKKSVFQAHLLKIDDENKINDARKQLADQNKRVQEATHNIMAYRIIKTTNNKIIELSNYDDDGETQAGSRLHLLLQLTDSKNVLIVVSRYFGGIKLGPDRFKYINEVAKLLLQEHGLISHKEGKNSKSKKKK